MNNKTMTSAEAILRDRKKRGARNALLLCLAILVVAGVVGVFHLPATAKTYQKWVLTCPAEAPAGPGYAGFFLHTHNDDCFDENGNLVCPLPEIKAHVHDDNCFVVSRELDCAIPESDGHQHTAECYTRVRGDLTCTLSTEPVLDEEGNVLEEGHVHTDECYAWHEELICGKEAGEGAHHHDENCYRTVTTLTCDKPEIIPHVHTDACLQKNEDGSVYVDESGNTLLICGMQELTEHVHGPECFTVYELDDGVPEETGETYTVTTESESGIETETVTVTGIETETETVTEVTPAAEGTEEAGDGFIFLYPEEDEDVTETETETETETLIGTEDTGSENADEAETVVTEAADEENTEQENQEADPADSQETEEKETTEEDKEDEEPADKEITEGEQETEETGESEETPEAVPTHQLGSEKGGATVLAEVPESILGETARLSLDDYSADDARAAILTAVNENAAEGEEREIISLYVIDIVLNVNGQPMVSESETPIRITIRAKEIRGMTAPKVYQLINGTAVRIEEADFDPEAGTVSFTASGFSAFAIADLTGEDPADEAPEETPVSVSMPAQTFEADAAGVVVTVDAPEGAFPAGTTMVVSPVEMDDDTLSNVTGAVESSGEKKVVTAQAVDISFFDAEQNLIEPKLPIKVSMKSAIVSERENVALVHLTETDTAKTVENETPENEASEAPVVPAAPVAEVVTDVQVVENPDEDNEIQFESDAFSVYVLVGTETITTRYLTADGETYLITVTYGPEAMIPEGAGLAVAEIPQDSEEYATYLAQAQSAVNADSPSEANMAETEAADAGSETESATETDGTSEDESPESSAGSAADRVTVTTARFFDITILDADGSPVEPAAPVDVKIEYAEPAGTAENYQVVHFGAETEVLNPTVSGADGSASAFDFKANSFSVFGIVGTETIEATYLTSDGETYKITVNYTKEAGIPKGSNLVVREILRGTEEYDNYRAQTEEALGIHAAMDDSPENEMSTEDAEEEDTSEETEGGISFQVQEAVQPQLTFIRLFDITILHDGEKVEPQVPVQVTITYVEPVSTQAGTSTDIVHFAETGTEVIGDVTVSEDGTELMYEQSSFSVVGTAQSAVGEGDYIIYRTSNNYALKWDLKRQSVSIGNNMVTSENDNVVWTFTSYGNGYRISYESNGTTYYLRNNSGTLTTTTNISQASTWTYSNHRLTSGNRSLRYSSPDFSLNNSGSDIYLAKVVEPATLTIHYVNESGEEISEPRVLDNSSSSGVTAITDIVQSISGYTYHNTYLNGTSGTQIVPELRGAGGGTWEYQVYGQETYTQFSGDTDVYVVYGDAYGSGSSGSGGGSGGDVPDKIEAQSEKVLISNDDGTYTLSLSVIGKGETKTESKGANVILILDTSNSMNTGDAKDSAGHSVTRFEAARDAAQGISTELLALNDEEYPDLVEMCLVEFNWDVATSDWYTVAGEANESATDPKNKYPSDSFNYKIANASRNSGTNWEGALQAAIAAANGHQDGDATYIIFLTDGNPSSYTGTNNGNGRYDNEANTTTSSSHYYRISDNYMHATDEARRIVQNGWEFYSVGMYGNVDVLKYLTNFAYTGRSDGSEPDSGNYYPAAETDQLIAALDNIAGVIKNSILLAGVQFNDGLAQDVTATALTPGSGSVQGVTYKKKGGTTAGFTVEVDQNGGTIYTIGNTSYKNQGSTAYTWVLNSGTGLHEYGAPAPDVEIGQKTVSYKKLAPDNGGVTESDATGTVYYAKIGETEYLMPMASIDGGGQLTWSLAPLGTLEPGVTYTVSFVVWPDQKAYDILADLNNGKRSWNSDTQEPVYAKDGTTLKYYKNGVEGYPNIVYYPSAEVYAALTNTNQTLDYFIKKENDGVVTYETTEGIAMDTPDPMGLDYTKIKVQKDWVSSLDPKEIADAIEEEGADRFKVRLSVYMDGHDESHLYETFYFLPVDSGETGTNTYGETYKIYTWEIHKGSETGPKTDELYIAPGVMVSEASAQESGLPTENYPMLTKSGNLVTGETSGDSSAEKYYVLETGHDYYLEEIGFNNYHFDYVASNYHPMVIDGHLGNIAIDLSTQQYQVVKIPIYEFLGENTLRGGISVYKQIVDSNGNVVVTDGDTPFVYRIALHNEKEGLFYQDGALTDDASWYMVNGCDYHGNDGHWYKLVKTDTESGTIYEYVRDDNAVTYISTRGDSGYILTDKTTGEVAVGLEMSGNQLVMQNGDPKTIGETVTITPGDELRIINVPINSTYTVEEVETAIMEGYSFYKATADNTKNPAVVGSTVTATILPNTGNTVTYQNKFEGYLPVAILKTDDSTGEALSGAEFKLYRMSGSEKQYVLKDHNNNEISSAGTITSDKNGSVLIGVLTEGEYYLEETKAPPGYEALEGDIQVTVSAGGVAYVLPDGTSVNAAFDSVQNRYTIQAPNTAVPSKKVGLFKVAMDKIQYTGVPEKVDLTKGALTGAEFDLYSYNTETKMRGEKVNTASITSDEQGIAVLGDLNLGTYALAETKSPPGFNMLTEDIIVTVEASGVSYSMGNTALDENGKGVVLRDDGTIIIVIPNNPGVELPQTGGEGTLHLRYLGMTVMLGAALLLLARQRQKKES